MKRLLTLTLMIGLAGAARAEIDIQEVTSPGGITAWLVEEHSIPFTAVEIRFAGGASLDAPGKRGAINLMTGLIEEGAGDLDARGFAAARDAMAATYRFDVDRDTLSVSARMLTENRDQAVELLRTALTAPRFDADAVERVRGQVLSIIASDAQDPNSIAGRAFAEKVYGMHPYGSDLNGTAESVSALTREDIVEAMGRVMVRGTEAAPRVFVSAAGDITPEALGAMLDRLLGDLPAEGAPLPGPARLNFDGGTEVIDYPVPQSVALFGQPGIERDDPDFFAAFLANEIFGGSGRQSRLTEEVREKRGLTYGIGSYLVDYDHADLVLGQFASANGKVAGALGIVKDEWARIDAGTITEAELESAKTYLTGEYPLRFDGNGRIANILVGMQTVGLPASYVNTRNAQIEAVTLADVNRVAARLYDPAALFTVVVGQPEGLGEQGKAGGAAP